MPSRNRLHHDRPKNLLELMPPKDWVALFVACLSLTVSVWSGYEERKHNVLGARAHLQIAEQFASSSPRHGLVVFNYGPGMAFVDGFQLSLDGKPLYGTWDEQWDQFRQATGVKDWTNRGAFQAGDAVAANPTVNAEILLIVDEASISKVRQLELSPVLREAIKRLTVSITYHTIYGEGFRIEKTGLHPEHLFRRGWFGSYAEWQE